MLRDKLTLVIPPLAALTESLVGGLPLHVAVIGVLAALLLSLKGRQEACFPAVYGGLLLYGLILGRGRAGMLSAGFILASMIHMVILDAVWRKSYRGFVEAEWRIMDLLPDASALISAALLILLAYAAADWTAAALLASRLPGLRYLGGYYSGIAGKASLMLVSAYLVGVILGKTMKLFSPLHGTLISVRRGESWASRLAERVASASNPRSAAGLLGYMLLLIAFLVSALNASWFLAGLVSGLVARIALGKRLGGTMAFALGMVLATLILAGPSAGYRILLGAENSAKSFEALLQGILGG